MLNHFSVAVLHALVLGLLALTAGVRPALSGQVLISAPGTLAELWAGKARFARVGTLNWQGAGSEQAGSFVVYRGIWYVFNRVSIDPVSPDCRQDNAQLVVRASRDNGQTWSAPVTVATPSESPEGIICAVVDGSAVFDEQTATWHLLAQCLGAGDAGWSLCHYSRRSAQPLGRFVADKSNPVVEGGALWSRLCAGSGKACPATTRDEGTPDIMGKRDGSFLVTFHGFDPVSLHGFRGVAETRDFHNWRLTGPDLPNDATLGPRDCRAWLIGCAGVGAATLMDDPMGQYQYMIVETMTKSLQCTPGQQWRFELIRSQARKWPRSGGAGWERLPEGTLITTAHPSKAGACPVQYARLFRDGGKVYLVYEDWDRIHGTVDRPLLMLIRETG